MEDKIRQYLKNTIVKDAKMYLLKYENEIITGYNGKYLFKSKRSAAQSLSYRFCTQQEKDVINNLKKSGIITIQEIDFNNLSLSEDELLQKFINEKLK